jgi:opacity protein-like surface antigen
MKKLLGLVLGLVLLAAPAFAADVDGKWTGMIDTPMGALPVGFTFKADGNALTGTSLGPDGAEIPIKDGKVDGNKIAFTVAIDFGGMAIVLNYSGVVSPDKIQFTGDFMGMPFEFVVDKAK